jgi:proline racemase
MRSRRVIHTVESHTEGMPTRVVTGGVGVLPGDTMGDRRRWFLANADGLRRFLMNEPRGHSAMSGAILQPATRPDADVGVLYIEVSGCLPMCGHGTMGVATVLVETGMVEVVEPVTTIRLDTPAGLVVAEVQVADGAARAVTIRNVPSFSLELAASVEVPGFGAVGYDMAFGGNFSAIVPIERLGIPFARKCKQQMVQAALALMQAINDKRRPVHPDRPEITGCRHVQLVAPGSNARLSRHAMVVHPGWIDRSPCGTGTSARMAQLHARGELPLQVDFLNESLIGTRFVGRLVAETRVGVEGVPNGDVGGGGTGPRSEPAVVPTVTGRAWITGTAQYHLDPTDPFPEGFEL